MAENEKAKAERQAESLPYLKILIASGKRARMTLGRTPVCLPRPVSRDCSFDVRD